MITQKVCVEQRLKPCISLDLPSCAISVFTPTWGLIPKEIFQWLPGSKMLRMVWTRSVLPAPEISLSKERWWSGETEEMKDKEKKFFFLRKKHTKIKTEAEVLPGFPEFQWNALRGLVLSSPFSLGKKKPKTCHVETRKSSIHFLYFQSSFLSYFHRQHSGCWPNFWLIQIPLKVNFHLTFLFIGNIFLNFCLGG